MYLKYLPFLFFFFFFLSEASRQYKKNSARYLAKWASFRVGSPRRYPLFAAVEILAGKVPVRDRGKGR
jgi:hypothetical protein